MNIFVICNHIIHDLLTLILLW